MVVHEEFSITLLAPDGGECDFCYLRAEHGLLVKDDHGIMAFKHGNLCQVHTLYYTTMALHKGVESVRGR